jgi:hypothetical protein
VVVIIEVQHGSYLGEDDIIRRKDDYGRIAAKSTASVEARDRGRQNVRRPGDRRASPRA